MENEKRILESVAGFSREIGFYLSGFEKARTQTKKLLEDLSNEEIARRILNLHSIGAIAMHLGECQFWYIQSIVGGREMTDEEKKLCHWLDTLEADYDRGYSAEYCIETLDKITEINNETLAEFTDDDLENIYVRTFEVEKPIHFSLRWILQLSNDHEAHHRGQISMIKRLMRENA